MGQIESLTKMFTSVIVSHSIMAFFNHGFLLQNCTFNQVVSLFKFFHLFSSGGSVPAGLTDAKAKS